MSVYKRGESPSSKEEKRTIIIIDENKRKILLFMTQTLSICFGGLGFRVV